jgi:hypothetical protein
MWFVVEAAARGSDPSDSSGRFGAAFRPALSVAASDGTTTTHSPDAQPSALPSGAKRVTSGSDELVAADPVAGVREPGGLGGGRWIVEGVAGTVRLTSRTMGSALGGDGDRAVELVAAIDGSAGAARDGAVSFRLGSGAKGD